ncbi:MAG: hypothetical protein PUE41_00620, partial [bacterium]|nr:hypothetical protein [bacterium]
MIRRPWHWIRKGRIAGRNQKARGFVFSKTHGFVTPANPPQYTMRSPKPAPGGAFGACKNRPDRMGQPVFDLSGFGSDHLPKALGMLAALCE